jgi:hypothetical protein
LTPFLFILYKFGIGPYQQELVREGQEILRKYDINPIYGVENLVYAPNIKGQHNAENLIEVVDGLKQLEAAQATRKEIVDFLQEMGNKAALRR